MTPVRRTPWCAPLFPGAGLLDSEASRVPGRAAWGGVDIRRSSAARCRKTRIELANAIFEYLEVWHNRQRRHSRLDMLTPIEFENRQLIIGA